jgi:hypothetical protein
MSKLYNAIGKYMRLAFAYGFARKIYYMNEIKEYTIIKNNKKYKQPILYSDYIFASTICGFFSIYGLPLYVINDIRNMEIKSRYKVIHNEYRCVNEFIFDGYSYDYELD